MTKNILAALFTTLCLSTFAQTTVTDSVSLGASLVGISYPNDVFYDMRTGTVSTVAGGNWQLAFAMRNAAPPFNVMRSTTILANEGRGVTVYESTQPVSSFASFDTTGYMTWATPHNSDSTWDVGALNANRTNSAVDYGWGEYDMLSHDLTGTKIFMIRIALSAGPNPTYTYKKIMIERLAFDTSWVFTYANIDNSATKTITLNKSAYAGKLFAYHNLLSDSTIDREPSAKWDLLFTRYGTFVTQFGQTVFSPTTGVLSYPTLLTSTVSGVPTDSAEAGAYAHFLTGIGTDWKINPGPGQPGFVVKDSLSYFTKDETGHEHKLVFVSFSGSSTGTIVFNKTNIVSPVGIAQPEESPLVNMYPNPAQGTLYLTLNQTDDCTLSIIDIAGRTHIQQNISEINSAVDISTLQTGVYFVSVQNSHSRKIVKLIVQ